MRRLIVPLKKPAQSQHVCIPVRSHTFPTWRHPQSYKRLPPVWTTISFCSWCKQLCTSWWFFNWLLMMIIIPVSQYTGYDGKIRNQITQKDKCPNECNNICLSVVLSGLWTKSMTPQSPDTIHDKLILWILHTQVRSTDPDNKEPEVYRLHELVMQHSSPDSLVLLLFQW